MVAVRDGQHPLVVAIPKAKPAAKSGEIVAKPGADRQRLDVLMFSPSRET
jgi:hypothetical protein